MCPSGRSLSPPSTASSSSAAGSAVHSSFRPAFDVLDSDRDGKISRDDLRAFYAGRAAPDVDDDVIGTMMTVADTNKDGFVEYEEFERVVLGSGGAGKKNGSTSSATSFLEEMFKVMDKDGDGQLSHRDLKSFMEMASLAVTDDDIDAMIMLAGGDRNGGVTFEGLHGILMNR
ncbi:calcium-binding protein CP1-like [Prosopis cineraria]|uniref:calcium-binding protein CP1-like n=1 Tax=Prosopis cineraria TaxID=364024 RepID=UPI00240F2A81|nr:calcium-binding protein CP1-like [Prosopis cineraria]